MGLGMASIKLYLELYHRGVFKNSESVIEMGSQELHLKKIDFENLIRISGMSNYSSSDFVPWEWPAQPRCSSRAFFRFLGFKKYNCVDLNQEHGAVSLDLNLPLQDNSLFSKFDLVTDHGCNEHVFNTGEAYRTMHRLCKSGGIMLIDQSVWEGNGYYLYDLSFFEGLAAANSYKILYSGYVVTFSERTSDGSNIQYHVPLSRNILDALDRHKVESVGITYVFQKKTDEAFCYPYQGSFLSEQQKNHGYMLSFFPDPPGRTYVPIYSTSLGSVGTKELLRTILKRLAMKFGGRR